MLEKAFTQGQRAMGYNSGNFFAPGQPLDGVVYDNNIGLLADTNSKYTIPRILYNADSSWINGTLINGQWIVKNGFHKETDRANRIFSETLRSINIES